MLNRLFLLCLFCLLLNHTITGQDTVVTDTIPVLVQDSLLSAIDAALDTSDVIPWPNPKKALLWSIIPSGGQVYNRRWWKVPLVVGGFYALYRTIDYNTDLHQRFITAYQLKLDDQEHEFTGTGIDNVTTLRNLRDRYDKNTQMSYVFLFLGYVLQGVEAYVDAHLRQFDIDDDLSFRLKPTLDILPISGQPMVGVGLVIPIQ